MKLRQLVTAYLQDPAYQPLTREELAEIFEIDKNDRKSFHALLRELEREGRLRFNKKDKIIP